MYFFCSSNLSWNSLSEINELPTKCICFTNNEWLNDFTFLVDIRPAGHLNNYLKFEVSVKQQTV